MPTHNLTLTEEQREMLREILQSYLSDLRMEVADTDSYDYRQPLKRKEEFLKELLVDL